MMNQRNSKSISVQSDKDPKGKDRRKVISKPGKVPTIMQTNSNTNSTKVMNNGIQTRSKGISNNIEIPVRQGHAPRNQQTDFELPREYTEGRRSVHNVNSELIAETEEEDQADEQQAVHTEGVFEHDSIEVVVHAEGDEFIDDDVDDDTDWEEDGDNTFDEHEVEQLSIRSEVVISDKTKQYLELQKMLKDNPALHDMVEEIVDQRIQQKDVGSQKHSKSHSKSNKNVTSTNFVNNDMQRQQQQQAQNRVKSPSDTTLYTPALKQGVANTNMINRISDFVENIRLETASHDQPGPSVDGRWLEPQAGPLRVIEHSASRDGQPDDTARSTTDEILLHSEKFKASIATPKGKHENALQLANNLLMPAV